MNLHWTDRLSEFQDDELAPLERAACDAHLAECEQCRGVLRELQLVTSAARADLDREPSTDLWLEILSQIQRSPVAQGPRPAVGGPGGAEAPPSLHPSSTELAFRRRHITFSLPQLALAASLLIAVSAGVSYVAAGRALNRPAALDDPILAMAETMMAPSADAALADFADAQFDQAVSDLEQILREQRHELDPRTVVVIERNLAAIDGAIRQARAALDADPANTFLNSHLADARRKKLDLLRRATAIASPSGD